MRKIFIFSLIVLMIIPSLSVSPPSARATSVTDAFQNAKLIAANINCNLNVENGIIELAILPEASPSAVLDTNIISKNETDFVQISPTPAVTTIPTIRTIPQTLGVATPSGSLTPGINPTPSIIPKVLKNHITISPPPKKYSPTCTFVSANLLASQAVNTVNSLTYALSALPLNTKAEIAFSQDSILWYDSSGQAEQTDIMIIGRNTIDLTKLNFFGPNFYYTVIFTSDGQESPILDEISVDYTSGLPPLAPVSLLTAEEETTDGSENPKDMTAPKPFFSAIYDDNIGDVADYYQLLLFSDNQCTLPVWDSKKIEMPNCTQGDRCNNIPYAGPPLSQDGTTYYWQIKFWDDDGLEGPFSSCSANFTMQGPGDQLRHGAVINEIKPGIIW